MATRIRTLDFLPEIFKTPTNAQFLSATLDQLTSQPNTKKIQGYIGSKFGYGVNPNNYYVTEPTKTRTDYQLEPGVVFTNQSETNAKDFISYPGILDALKLQGGITDNNDRLFNSQFYSWDPFVDLDKIINFNQYYWLPAGPPAVNISTSIIYNSVNFLVQNQADSYLISSNIEPTGTVNPTLTLLRGGTYTFTVNQNSQFWIQGAPGVTGYSPTQPNLQTRDVYGVSNNGAEYGVITFQVPEKNALDQYNFPTGPTVDVISTLPFSQVNGALVSTLGGIDGVTSLNNLTVMFYDTGVEDEYGYVNQFYGQTLFDEDGGSYPNPFVFPGTPLDDNNYEGGYYTEVNSTFYTINLIGDPSNPQIQLTPSATIPTNQKIKAVYGTQWINLNFFRNTNGTIQQLPYDSAILDTLYYQDGTTASKVGVIKLVDNNNLNTLNIITDILGKQQYTSSSGVVFTNGLKVTFQGDIYPTKYASGEYYVQGVGTAIELIDTTELVSPGLFAEGQYIPYDTTPYDIGNYDITLYIPVEQDYITIARNSINRNAWSRSNRWFHVDVINASATYNNDPTIISTYATQAAKAVRPIIEFYPNLQLFNSGTIGKLPIDFIDTRTTDAFSQVAGKTNYYPDVAGYTTYNATIAPVTGASTKTATNTTALINQITLNNTTGLFVNDTITFTGSAFGGISTGVTYYITSITGNNITISSSKQGTTLSLTTASGSLSASVYPYSTLITIPTADVSGLFEIGQYIADSTLVLPSITFITDIQKVGSNTVLTVSWYNQSNIAGTSVASVVTANTALSNYGLFDGSRVVFAADTNLTVRNKIYVSQFSTTSTNGIPVITLTEAEDGLVLPYEQTTVYRGYNYQGTDFYYDGTNWLEGQQKTNVNQKPYFDVFDNNGVSFGDSTVYQGTSFIGSTLFSYGIGTGTNDSVLGFPILYSGVTNIGDISFVVTFNSDTFTYVSGLAPITQQVNTGYVYNYTIDGSTYVRQLGWQTAVSPSVQYQIFEFSTTINPTPTLVTTSTFNCDIAPLSSSAIQWPTVQVYIDNIYLDPANYTVVATDTTTQIQIASTYIPITEAVVQILILSDQVSASAYYQTPININNNPFNTDITVANVGDIRRQYQSIFYNNPNTTGEIFGPNNYRDLGNLVPWGNAIIQNSASMVLPGAFLRGPSHNLFDSLLYNGREYITFKDLLVYTVNSTNYASILTPAQMLDDALTQIASTHSSEQSFFWSDMVPCNAPYISNTYTFANSLDISIYPLSTIYDFTTANYSSVLVYLTSNNVQTQLIKGVDYTVSSTAPSLTVTYSLSPGDIITVNEYNKTYGSYVPNTPTKLGLYPATIPSVSLDTAYYQPTYFIVGHDGSYNKLYGNYNPTTGALDDFRDQVLLEYETRVYNNLKLSNVIPIQEYEVLPGFFRTTQYTYDEFLQVYSEGFLNWVGTNRIDYKTQFYSKANDFTYNYTTNSNKLNQEPIQQGYFRGLYLYYYDTSTPDQTPWEMIGYTTQPTWWTSRYGSAPYTSDNLVLWNDMAEGVNWNNGKPFVNEIYVRDGLLNVLPVDSNGDLVSPMVSILGNYNANSFQRDWKVGDVGPAEFSYRRSSTWPFDLMRLYALAKPAQFFNLGVDVDNYKYNAEFSQFLVNGRDHLIIKDIPIYGTGTPATSYINWIVDYEKQLGIDSTGQIINLFNNLDVRLVYRLAGFSDSSLLNFYLEKSSANSNNSSLLIPSESYNVVLYENQPFDRIVYSGVVIQITANGYKVYGNSQTNAYFKVLVPNPVSHPENISVDNLSVKLSTKFYDKVILVPYGTEFYSAQEVAQFINGYSAYLTAQGMIYDTVENGIPVTWYQMITEFLYWAQMGWDTGVITTLNPSAASLSINRDSYVVQPLALQERNFVLNQNLYPIKNNDLAIQRDGTLFHVCPKNQGDAISYGQFNISNIEHGIVFSNVTLFNDIVYNLVTGLRQNRIYVRGVKTADWNGTLDANGFILNQNNILPWDPTVTYTTGSIVTYKNKYWFALQIVQPNSTFVEKSWKITEYNEIQKGLLPNGQTRAYESTLYYDTYKNNLDEDANLLSYSLIGYRPRDYLATVDLTDITQINVYQNMIREKGTKNALNAFKGANLPQGGINYDVYENWSILSGEFGATLNNNYVDLILQQNLLTGNPSIVGLTNGEYTDGVQQEVPLYSLANYSEIISDPNILPTISPLTPSEVFPTAGYVNFNDVKMSSFYYSGLSTARNINGTVIPLSDFYVRDYAWVANYLSDWDVFTPISIGSIIDAKNNLNGTVTITFTQPHNLKQYQIFAIVNFNTQINNYYIVAGVIDSNRILINLSLNPQLTNITGLGIGFKFDSQRVASAPEISTLPSLLDNEFNSTLVWTDTNNDGSWAVYKKTLNYKYDAEILLPASETFGTAVAYSTDLGYLIGDSAAGKVYRYTYNTVYDTYVPIQTLTHSATFGSTISYSGNTYVISETSGNVYIYELVTNTLVNSLGLVQTISAQGGSTNWGHATAISGDKNWLYISATDLNRVYVYRKSTVTNSYELMTSLTVAGLDADAEFGYSIATDYYGDSVIIGAPYQNYDVNTNSYGYTYLFNRTVQTFEATSASQSYIPQAYVLAWTPATTTKTTTSYTSNALVLSNTTGVAVNTPFVITGTPFGGLALNTVYYVKTIVGNNITVSLTRGGTAFTLVGPGGSMDLIMQNDPLYVTINGTLIDDSSYAVIGSTLYMYSQAVPILNYGDLLTVSSPNFVLAKTFTNEETPRIGVEFGTSVATNNFANEILIGAPFELSPENYEGAVHRFTNGGEKYGIIVGTDTCNITTTRKILLNGFVVTLLPGNATTISNIINNSNITNVTSAAIDGKLIIQLIDVSLGQASNKLSLTVLDTATLGELGINLFTQTQKIMCPHLTGPTQFGSTIKFNEFGSSIVVSAPAGTRYSATTFDFTDDGLDNDTVFDNNATQWIDPFVNAGAVYMFDYLGAYNESLDTPGKFVYAQSVNAYDLDYGSQPMYGTALDYHDNVVTIGTPNFNPTTYNNDTNGQVIAYVSTSSTNDWAVYRTTSEIVDINNIGPILIYSAETNNTLVNLDYFDPLQGKMLGAVRENIDIISNTDPAVYNSIGSTLGGRVWGAENVGKLWFDTSTTRFVNYHQNDISYNSRFWGTVFPGSNVSIYSWVASNVPPNQYTGPGTARLIDTYVVHADIDAQGAIVPIYYFWAKNTNIVNQAQGKTLADSTLELYISQPQGSGISYFSPLLPNIFALYNCSDFINNRDSVLHVGYSSGNGNGVAHTQYNLIRAGYPDDFLPGLPTYTQYNIRGSALSNQPTSLYARMLDSLSGTNRAGAVVPDPFLPPPVRTGVLVRPRQSFFYDRLGALNNYINGANAVLLQYPFNEIANSVFLYKVGDTNPSTGLPFYNVGNYVENVNWWAPGYNNNTRASVQVPIYADLSTLNVPPGTIASVQQNGNGFQETYVLDTALGWVRIGLQYGTIQISSAIYDYANNSIGFGNNFYDTTPYDTYPSEETRYIIRALNEELPDSLLPFRNTGLILLFEYIQSETIENQNFLPWLNKTSLVDVSHTIRELVPLQVFQSDNQIFLEGYINEVKPYHVVIKDFLFAYTKTDVYEGYITDFDLPAQYNTTVKQFITPELVYSSPSGDNQYLPTDPIWQESAYIQWFNNYGLSIIGENSYPISTLESYLAFNTNSCYVNNITGFPVTGVITINGEDISYSNVNLATGQLLGLSRGYNGTAITQHIPGEPIVMNLPPVLVLNTGRGYSNPPKITAYIDTTIYPAPRVQATFTAIMNLDKVIGVTVTNPGQGYAVLPKIVIDPAFVVTISSTQVNLTNNTIDLTTPLLTTGDLVVYTPAEGSTIIGGLIAGERYFVNVLESSPNIVVALYESYLNCINDDGRIPLISTGTGYQNFSVGAVASCISSAIPVRENSIKLKFDRTTYNSQVIDWEPSGYYGAFYAGTYSNSELVSSSSITLESTQPDINTILASAEGAPFEILNVTNSQDLIWSSRTRNTVQTYGPASLYPNTIRIIESDGGSPVTTTLGATVGFYVGMPIKFIGAAVGNLTNYTTYYVKSLVNLPNTTTGLMEATGFTVSSSISGAGVPGSTLVLTNATVPSSGLLAYPGEVTNTAILDINYTGIRSVTATTAGLNYVTVQLTPTGQNGTTNFYVGLPIFFTGDVFGDVVANEIYYVTTVVNPQTFTMSTTNDPLMLTATATSSSNNAITCASTLDLSVNLPIIFTGTVFGGIQTGKTYYISQLLPGNTSFTISESVNGAVVVLSTATGSCKFTSQANTLGLTTGTGSMTLNINLSINPGQIQGQKFTAYPTSNVYTNVTGVINSDSLINRDITATLPTVNRVCVSQIGLGINNIYANMQFNVSANIGGLTTSGGPYTVLGTGVTSVNVTNTTSSGNWLTVPTTNSTNVLYVGMPIYFTGSSLGGVLLNVAYYVHSINGSPPAGVGQFTIAETTTSVYPFNVTTDNGSMTGTGDPYITLSNTLTSATTNSITLTQYINPSNYASFDVSYILGGYRVSSHTAGTGYAVDNIITILGTSVGGTTTANDLTLTVSGITSTGGISSTIATGIPNGPVREYYIDVVDLNQVALYSDPTLKVAVSGQDLPYHGVTSTTATAVTASNDRITVTDSTIFDLNDPVIFTGTVFGGITIGQTYYILTKPTATTVTISTTIGGSTFNITQDAVGSMTIASPGDYLLLPEPFYFNSSIVKYNNNVYQCIVSNNDSEFIFGKWERLTSGSNKLNALDRIIGYYQPTVNMPGVDLTQLVTGITYPNSTYLGNPFAPAEEYTLDTILSDQPFYPTGINLSAVLYNNLKYIATSDTSNNSAINTSTDGITWSTLELSNTPIGLYDIEFINNEYVLTGSNSATPILISSDQIHFSTPANIVPSLGLNAVTYHNGLYVAVGTNIVTATDVNTWTQRYEFTGSLQNNLYDVIHANTTGYTGFVAVGAGQIVTSTLTIATIALIFNSTDGISWSPVTFTLSSGLKAIASNNQTVVVVGDDGVIYTSANTITWFPQTSGTVRNLTNIIWDSVNSKFVAIGDHGTILTGTLDGITWTVQSSGVTEDLTSVTYNTTANKYLAVGYNNTVLQSTNGVTWTENSIFSNPPTVYNVQGDSFTSGYGPEELVPGVVTDTVTMTIATRPGTNWDATVYQNVGYGSVSSETQATSGTQLIYSFANIARTPTELAVYVTSYSTGLSTRVYEETGFYSVDWVNQNIILANPLSFTSPGVADSLRIDLYETGNGDQLVKSSTRSYPVRENLNTGFQEIILNADYTASIYQGSGIVRPNTGPLEQTATATSATTNQITLDSVENISLNGIVTFAGAVFGNIQIEQQYYVKTIDTISNRISISETINVSTGTAGPTFVLSTASGSMEVIIQVGVGVLWTPPAVYHNGVIMTLGGTSIATNTDANDNTIVVNSTYQLVVNTPVVFDNDIFGGIEPYVTYYVKAILSHDRFTISETIGGPVFELTTAEGIATYITNDFAIGLADDGINAKMVLAQYYDTAVDYIAYTFMGETLPVQYGYTLPQTQVFFGNSSTAQFTLLNYCSGANPDNAIVEINGLRQTAAAYTINDVNNTITFYSPPPIGSTVAVTTFNLTDRQYLNTQYGITGSPGSQFITITVGATVNRLATYDENTPNIYTFDEDTPQIVAWDEQFNYLTLSTGTTALLVPNSPVVFSGSTFGGIVAGQVYYIKDILDSTSFSLSTQVGGSDFVVSSATGTMTGTINGLTVANIVNINNAITPVAATILVSATHSATDTVECNSTALLVPGQYIIFKDAVPGTFGGINTNGQYYLVGTISSLTEFTITDQFGATISLSDTTGSIIGYAGGVPAIRVTTGINHNLGENSLIRIDGVVGSIQLNNNLYYAKIVTDKVIDLYLEEYDPTLNAPNFPVTVTSTYVSGGYVWLDRVFTIADTSTISSSSNGNRISVDDATGLVPNTPVYFTTINALPDEDILGGILADVKYYVYEVQPTITAGSFIVGNQYTIVTLGSTNFVSIGASSNTVGVTFTATGIGSGTGTATALQEFTISSEAYPNQSEFVLTNETGQVFVSQFTQSNVDRLWVTVNGLRVPSSKLKLNPYNDLSILTTIQSGDEVIITSMMPTATPNEEIYLLNVTTTNQPSVFRTNETNRTWLTKALQYTDSTIYLNDVSRVTSSNTFEATCPVAASDGDYYIGLSADKNAICYTYIYNNTTGIELDADSFQIVIVDTAPIIQINNQVTAGDSLTITVGIGRLIYINGEQIGFADCDLINNTVSKLSRGTNGTGTQNYIPNYSPVYGINSTNRMTDVLYNSTWNPIPGYYNETEGDPLQIAYTQGADFLRGNVN
jgi:hypothetical protein